MDTMAMLERAEACEEATEWVSSQEDQSPEALWASCPRGDWMLWWVEKHEVKVPMAWRLRHLVGPAMESAAKALTGAGNVEHAETLRALAVECATPGGDVEVLRRRCRDAAARAAAAAAAWAAWAAARAAARAAWAAAAADTAAAAADTAAWAAARAAARAAWVTTLQRIADAVRVEWSTPPGVE